MDKLQRRTRIGERRLSGWSAGEQAGVGEVAETLTALADANAAYEQRFGHVFLICATGRGPAEILAELNRRMSHDPATRFNADRRSAGATANRVRNQLGCLMLLSCLPTRRAPVEPIACTT